MTLSSFAPTAISGSFLEITSQPNLNDIIPYRQQILLIEDSDVTITMTDDSSTGVN